VGVESRKSCQELSDVQQPDAYDPLSEIVAKKIIEIGATGVRDPVEIAKIAVSQLGIH
jgi:hypothetical protein